LASSSAILVRCSSSASLRFVMTSLRDDTSFSFRPHRSLSHSRKRKSGMARTAGQRRTTLAW
jgi:hypothetical protein